MEEEALRQGVNVWELDEAHNKKNQDSSDEDSDEDGNDEKKTNNKGAKGKGKLEAVEEEHVVVDFDKKLGLNQEPAVARQFESDSDDGDIEAMYGLGGRKKIQPKKA